VVPEKKKDDLCCDLTSSHFSFFVSFLETIMVFEQFNELLQKCLKEFNSVDTANQVKWQYRRLREDDTAASLGLPGPLGRWQVVVVIEAIQIDPEDAINHMANEVDMVLPSYHAAVEDVVLDVGPLDQTNRHPDEERDLGNIENSNHPPSSLTYPLPPEYIGASSTPAPPSASPASPSPQPRQEMELSTLHTTSPPPTYTYQH
jgi:hypothetical protein